MKNSNSLPADVLAVKHRLQKTGDARLKMMCTLTEPSGSQYMSDYVTMWNCVEKASQTARVAFDGDEWVYSFLEAVIYHHQKPPACSYYTGKEKTKALERLWKYTKGLQAIYRDIGFEGYDGVPTPHPIDMLQSYAKRAEREIKESTLRGNRGDDDEPIRFIRSLAEANPFVYGSALNSVIKTAVFAIYGKECTESDITNYQNIGVNHAE